MASSRRAVSVLLLLTLLTACAREAPPEGTADGADPDPDAANAIPGRVFERAVVFLTSVDDSTLIVPWLFTARTKPGGVDRVARAWLDRGGEWESFLDQSWETTPTRVPWRLLPRGPLHLMVGGGESLAAIAFEEGPRRLEVELSGTRAVWSGTQGETWLVSDGTAVLSDRRLPGLVLDMARAHRGDVAPAGDWMFLASGDSVLMVLSGSGTTPGERGVFEGWARLADGREIPWRDLTVTWAETRAFDPARREVPVRWRVAAGSEMGVELTQRAAVIEAGEGEGPLLPVEALFEVAGTLRIAERTYPVRGLVRHVQR